MEDPTVQVITTGEDDNPSDRACFICSRQSEHVPVIIQKETFDTLCTLFKIPPDAVKGIVESGLPEFCEKCLTVIGNAIETSREIEVLQNRLAEMKNQLEGEITASIQSSQDLGNTCRGVFLSGMKKSESECRKVTGDGKTADAVPEGTAFKLEDTAVPSGDGTTQRNTEDQSEKENRGPFPCTQCSRSFQSMRARVAHGRVHLKGQSIKCSLCGSHCKNMEKFKHHFSRFHSNITGTVCPHCDLDLRTSPDEEILEKITENDREVALAKLHAEHLSSCQKNKQDVGEVAYECAKCKLSFKRKAQLRRHQLSVHEKDSESESEGHAEGVDDEDSEEYDAEAVEENAGESRNKVQGTEALFKCYYCPKQFATENARNGHGKIHRNVKPYRCHICSIGFGNFIRFRNHLTQRHPDADESVCQLCNSSLNTLCENGTFKCPVGSCDQSFDSLAKLRSHHLTECAAIIQDAWQRRLCLQCNKSFSDENELVNHISEVHVSSAGAEAGPSTVVKTPTEKADSTTSTDLREAIGPEALLTENAVQACTRGKKGHSRSVLSYRCSICGQSFSQLYGLKRHFRQHARSQTFCPLCGINFKATSQNGTAGRVFKCPLRTCCDRTFEKLGSIRSHHFLKCPENPKVKQKTRARRKLAFLCLNCPSRFPSVEKLKQHVTEAHASTEQATAQTPVEPPEKISSEEPEESAISTESQRAETKCAYCPQIFTTEAAKEEHVKTQHVKKSYTCKICRQWFTQVKNLRRHVLQIHRSNAQYMCHFCGESFQSEGPYSCRLFGCDQSFDSLPQLRSHHFLKCPENPGHHELTHAAYACDKCGRLFTTYEYLTNHVLSVHHKRFKPEENADEENGVKEGHQQTPPLKCPECPKVFASHRAMSQHIRVHEKPFQCKFCTEKFSHLRGMRSHFVTSHPNLAESACEFCGNCVLAGTADDSGLYPCPDEGCHSSFPTAALLRQHHVQKCNSRPLAGPESGHTCDRCGKSFVASGALKDHIASIHEQTFKLYCDKCGRGFQKHAELNRHVEFVHSDEKRFACEICNMRFKRANQLVYHRRLHTGEKPFVCEICGKAFHIPGKLRLHVALHSGKKDFPCPICGKMFASKNYVSYHINFTHKRRGRAKRTTFHVPAAAPPVEHQEVVFEVTTAPIIEIEFQPVSELEVHTTSEPVTYETYTVVDTGSDDQATEPTLVAVPTLEITNPSETGE